MQNELQFQKTGIPCLKGGPSGAENQEQTQELRLPEAYPDVGRCWEPSACRCCGARSGGGRRSASPPELPSVLYVPEDGSEVRSLQTWVPMEFVWDLPETDRDGPSG